AMWGVPAKQGILVFKQPDGTTVSLRKIGDARAHLVTTADGYPVERDADGFYCYADFEGSDKLKATSVRVKNVNGLSADERRIVNNIDVSKIAGLIESRMSASEYAAPQAVGSRTASSGIGLMEDSFLGRKELKGLVILAEYKDVKFSETCTREFYEEMLNREGFDLYGATGSARDYFLDSSNGQFTPEFDVYGPVTLPNTMAYYGGNNSAGNDRNAARMIYDACQGLDDEIDFSEYDLDGDGYVDNVFVFYAGYGEASYGTADSVWPHQWSLSYGGLTLILDGVRVNKYACSNELELDDFKKDIPCGIGTFVHEFSHVLGLPDLYVTSGYGSGWTPGAWDVLDQGPYNNNGRTPPAYSIYERNALGWIDPIVLDGPESITLEAISESNQGCIIETGNPNEFFLFENRQQTGWDKYIPGHGMLVWHIDYNPTVWSKNIVNDKSQHNYVDIEEARGSWASISDFVTYPAYYQALADYAFPGSLGVTSFTDDTQPSMRTWAGDGLGLPITDIDETDGVISFNVAGGRCEAAVPVIKEPSAVGEGWFEAAWEPAEGAVDYLLVVKAYLGDGEPITDNADFSEVVDDIALLPEGWSYIGGAGAVYTDLGYFGKSAPSLKLSKTGSGVETRKYDRDVESIEFWMKGFSTNAKSMLIVSGLINGEWVELQTIEPTRNAGTVYTLDELPGGIKQVRLSYKQSLGNVAIDDVIVRVASGGFTTLPGYSLLSVGNVCNHKVDQLMENVDIYTYKVCAVDINGRQSEWSEEYSINMSDNAGIADVVGGNSAEVSVDGYLVSVKGFAAGKIALSDLSGRVVAIAVVDAEGNASLTAPSKGVYILATPSGTHKIYVQ
ncbi:MAG: M6 family metalloprotease domain-containing protein, partial [Muribaculaceae bacterium]|nr:M6 family metalloprotease domain-containing protein [Muribaculaceae bacterium]